MRASKAEPAVDYTDALRRRMRAPQRHRLLQGFPMAPLMRPVHEPHAAERAAPTEAGRKLIVGVLPHPFCNPKVEGCGFCTFPHERFSGPQAISVGAAVEREITTAVGLFPDVLGRNVEALYFGGGTANLTPPGVFDSLCTTLSSYLQLDDAELTLEGVPRYFLTHEQALLDRLVDMPAGSRRISMGVQTFDERQLERMGRLAFGDRDVIANAVKAAHQRDMTTSADLLFNLPGQGRGEAIADVRVAAGIGFDQICIYNLVLFEGLGTKWSEDEQLLAILPSRKRRVQLWLDLRAELLALDYVQTTLTNFERRDVVESGRGFAYEKLSFTPDSVDGWGFGPSAITTTSRRRDARKWMNASGAGDYLAATEQANGQMAWKQGFVYQLEDLQLLHATRELAQTRMSLAGFAQRFGASFEDVFAEPLAAILDRKLMSIDDDALRFTPRGMFYADAALGLLAAKRVKRLRGRSVVPLRDDSAAHHHMG